MFLLRGSNQPSLFSEVVPSPNFTRYLIKRKKSKYVTVLTIIFKLNFTVFKLLKNMERDTFAFFHADVSTF